MEGALQHEVTSQATSKAELNIFKAKLTEAVLELEQRCAGQWVVLQWPHHVMHGMHW